jgi:hypothetical protein
MLRCRFRHVFVLVAILCALALPIRAFAQVQVVDMIPNNLSDEANGNGEPFLAVNPANPQILAATAFMPTPAMVSNGPLLVSTDGGNTWVAKGVIPSSAGGENTHDVTIRFNTSGTALYAGMIRDPDFLFVVTRTTDMTFNTPMTTISTPRGSDQPYIFARTVTGWFDPGKDRLWVGNNDGAGSPNTATVDQTLDAAIASPVFSQIRVDANAPVVEDNYQVRTVAHADGHVYAAFYRRKGSIAGGYNADVVVVRDDNWGKTALPFRSLVDTVTMVAGENVVANTPVSDSFGGSDPTLGLEWWGGDLFLTVDPNDASRVYISYSDSQALAPRTLHLRRSTDYGQTWGADILTTSSAKNAAIAINSHGRFAYVYQQLTGVSPNLRWQTHLRRSPDGSAWDDVTLADFPAQGAGSPGGARIIGDYMNMAAVGKNFYGVFSSYNNLTSATFPAGITWLRNKTAPADPSPRFLGNDGTTTVNPSIDPFFFRTTEMDPAADLYVRDWTDSATVHDRGQEPSVRADFYSTSDVWNERTNDPLAFDANDRPQVHDPQPTAMGHNYAFARVGREASGTDVDVTLRYYFSDGGVGVNFVSAGPSTSLHLSSGDLQQSPAAGAGLQWELPSGASNHVCLAVEISTPSDPILPPSLLGHAPGWPTTDLMVVNDNNKAQRNMQVFGFGGMAAGEAGGMASMYALAHNAATVTRDMTLGIAVNRADLARLSKATLRAIGGREPITQPIGPSAVLTLPRMEPGEYRWIELTFSPAGVANASAHVRLVELVNGFAVNGYAFIPTAMRPAEAIQSTLFQHAAVFTRLAEAHGPAEAREQARYARDLLDAKKTDPEAYGNFVKSQATALTGLTDAFLKMGGSGDHFGASAAALALAAAVSNPATAQPLHLTLLNKLDAALSMRQKAEGDLADIPQNVRWQRELFGRLKDLRGSREVGERSTAFLRAFEQQGVGVEAFPSLVASLITAYREAADRDATGGLGRLLDAVAAAKSPTALQRAHRAFLLALDASVPR